MNMLASRSDTFLAFHDNYQEEYLQPIRQGKDLRAVITHTQQDIARCMRVLMEDITVISDDINQLLQNQEKHFNNVCSESEILRTQLDIIPNQHLSASLMEMQKPPTSQQTTPNSPANNDHIVTEKSWDEILPKDIVNKMKANKA